MSLTAEPCGCHHYEDGDLAVTCESHTPSSCWNCDWPGRPRDGYCTHCGARSSVRPR